MQPQKEDQQVERFRARCRQRGLPFTAQRRAAYEALLARDDHPTAEQVFEAVRATLPDVSRMTVYRTLELLVDLGLVHKVCHPGKVARYDCNLHPHHHLVCVRCNRLVDFEEAAFEGLPSPRAARRLGFEVDDYTVQFRGVCADCGHHGERRSEQASRRRRS